MIDISTTITSAPTLVLSTNEERLLEEVLCYLRHEYPNEAALVEERFACVRNLGQAVSRFPSVYESQELRGSIRDSKNLLTALGHFSTSSRMMRTPTRIVASKGFLVAKAHAFSLLSLVAEKKAELQRSIHRVIFSIICTLMAEDVYISCLEDPAFNTEKRNELAEDLLLLWDHGKDQRSARYVPALEALWTAREASPPAFGTMEGSSELIRVSMDLDGNWQDFIANNVINDETRWALEEFLFGLSFEEVLEVRARLKRFGINAVDSNEVRSYLGTSPAYTNVSMADPRCIYDFYVERRDAAFIRGRTGLSGPMGTLEEIYLKYRIAIE